MDEIFKRFKEIFIALGFRITSYTIERPVSEISELNGTKHKIYGHKTTRVEGIFYGTPDFSKTSIPVKGLSGTIKIFYDPNKIKKEDIERFILVELL